MKIPPVQFNSIQIFEVRGKRGQEKEREKKREKRERESKKKERKKKDIYSNSNSTNVKSHLNCRCINGIQIN